MEIRPHGTTSTPDPTLIALARMLDLVAAERAQAAIAEIPVADDAPAVLLTTTEAGQRLRVSRTTVYALIKTGELAAVHVGRLCRIHPDDLADYADRLRAASATLPHAA